LNTAGLDAALDLPCSADDDVVTRDHIADDDAVDLDAARSDVRLGDPGWVHDQSVRTL
jgi:hypothetical protein